MSTAVKLSAVKIQKLWYCETSKVAADLTGPALYAILQDTATKAVDNVHGDTWQIEESAATVTGYKNALTGGTYRQDKEMGDIKMAFTIGQYDYATKADLLGGTGADASWKRSRGITNINKCMIALTQDNQYCIFPNAPVVAREANTDKAIGIAVEATALEPSDITISSEYWFDSSLVKAAA